MLTWKHISLVLKVLATLFASVFNKEEINLAEIQHWGNILENFDRKRALQFTLNVTESSVFVFFYFLIT